MDEHVRRRELDYKNLSFLLLDALERIEASVDRRDSDPLSRNRAVRKILRDGGVIHIIETYRKTYKPENGA